MLKNRLPRSTVCIEHIDRPIEFWKWLKKNEPEFVKYPRAWAKREALKVWREVRDTNSD